MAKWVIGVDPSASKYTESAAIGWATYRDGSLVATGELTPDPPYFTRARNWARNKIKHILIEDANAEICFGVETVYLGPNPNIFLGLIQCQSHICAAVLDSSQSFRFITPLNSFQASTGMTKYRGKGTRKSDIKLSLVKKYPQLEDVSEHEIDACAICEAIIKEK